MPEQRCRVFARWSLGRRARATGSEACCRSVTTDRRGALCRRGLAFWANRERKRTGGQFPPSTTRSRIGSEVGGRRCVTPRQTCPRPNGLGRNLRSKTRWFTGFCNSHQVSHFATFFIDARAEISVAESRFRFSINQARVVAEAPRPGRLPNALFVRVPWRGSRRGFVD